MIDSPDFNNNSK